MVKGLSNFNSLIANNFWLSLLLEHIVLFFVAFLIKCLADYFYRKKNPENTFKKQGFGRVVKDTLICFAIFLYIPYFIFVFHLFCCRNYLTAQNAINTIVDSANTINQSNVISKLEVAESSSTPTGFDFEFHLSDVGEVRILEDKGQGLFPKLEAIVVCGENTHNISTPEYVKQSEFNVFLNEHKFLYLIASAVSITIVVFLLKRISNHGIRIVMALGVAAFQFYLLAHCSQVGVFAQNEDKLKTLEGSTYLGDLKVDDARIPGVIVSTYSENFSTVITKNTPKVLEYKSVYHNSPSK